MSKLDQSIPPSDGVLGGTHPQISVLHSNLLILNGRKGYREVQFSSVTQSCPTVCNPVNHSTPGLPVHHQLPEFTQTHVHWVSDAIQPSHSLSSPSPPAFNLSQHQGLFKWVSSGWQIFSREVVVYLCTIYNIWRRKRQPTPVFLPGESLGQGSPVDCRLWGHIESDTTEAI